VGRNGIGAQSIVFIGRFQHAIDSKGRVSIPVKFRDVFQTGNGGGEKLIVSTDPDRCLVGYTIGEWHLLEDKIKNLPSMNIDVKDYLRFFYSSAVECPLDRQGRILIPPSLREHANLYRDTILIGMMNRMEIWDLERWKDKETQFSGRASDISRGLASLGM
jgi:MraZ protein